MLVAQEFGKKTDIGEKCDFSVLINGRNRPARFACFTVYLRNDASCPQIALQRIPIFYDCLFAKLVEADKWTYRNAVDSRKAWQAHLALQNKP